MEILKQSGLPRPRFGGVGAASDNNFPSTDSTFAVTQSAAF